MCLFKNLFATARADVLQADCWFSSSNVYNPERSHLEFNLTADGREWRTQTRYILTEVDEIDFDYSFLIDIGQDALYFYSLWTVSCSECPINVIAPMTYVRVANPVPNITDINEFLFPAAM